MYNTTLILLILLLVLVVAIAVGLRQAFTNLSNNIYLLGWGLIPPPPPASGDKLTKDDTLRLLQSVLRSLNASVQNTDDMHVFAQYQGENFIFEVVDTAEVRVIDATWHTLPVDDIEALSVLKTAVNRANLYVPATIFYTISKETGEVYVQSQKLVYLAADIPHLAEYMKRELTYLLYAHSILGDKINEVQRENT